MRAIDMKGRICSRLEVLHQHGVANGKLTWLCRCECGNEKIVSGDELRRGHVKSCGCLSREMADARKITHGLSKTSIYNIYRHIVRRCYGPETPFYKDYGGRGITMCDEWRNSFEAFYADMGDRPSTKHSIDRKDNDGNYEPSNCRWVTGDIQAQNSRAAKLNSTAVAVIRHMHSRGTSTRRLAYVHRVCMNTISNVVSRKTWSNYA